MLAASAPQMEAWKKWVSPTYSTGILPRLVALFFLRCQKADVYHITGDVHFLAMATPRKKTVITIHDCTFLRLYFGLARFIVKKLWLDWPVKRAAAIVAVSEATRQEIIAFTRCRPDKVWVIPSVIPQDFSHAPYPSPNEFSIPRILHIGTAPNKNLVRHIEALRNIPCLLHIIGKLTPSQTALLKETGIRYENSYSLRSEAMPEVYAQCNLLLFSSTLEGFGMPILEAQTVGRPVITSNASSMPWVAGRGACLVDPFNVASIREGLIRVMTDAKYRDDLVAEGHRNVERFRPEGVAGAYAEIYHTLG
jgi:glycosyltransferase involved in cell wall biosynthesis